MTTIAFAHQKGGVSKTTLAVNLAAEWVARGKRVLLVDADPQQTARTWAAVASEAGHPAPTTVHMGANLHHADQLPQLSQAFDITLIDCPPRIAEVMRAALMVADVAVIPCGPSTADTWALAETLEVVNAARYIRPELRVCVAITRVIPRTAIGRDARNVLNETGLPVLPTTVGFRVTYQEALAAGLGVTRYQSGGTAANEIRRLADDIEDFAQEHTENDRQAAREPAKAASRRR